MCGLVYTEAAHGQECGEQRECRNPCLGGGGGVGGSKQQLKKNSGVGERAAADGSDCVPVVVLFAGC